MASMVPDECLDSVLEFLQVKENKSQRSVYERFSEDSIPEKYQMQYASCAGYEGGERLSLVI